MSRTERDVMRGKRGAIFDSFAKQYPHFAVSTPDNRHEHHLAYQEYETTLRAAHIYQHICGPYCLMHKHKRYDRKAYRQRVKDALRHDDWFEAKHLRPKDVRK